MLTRNLTGGGSRVDVWGLGTCPSRPYSAATSPDWETGVKTSDLLHVENVNVRISPPAAARDPGVVEGSKLCRKLGIGPLLDPGLRL